MRNFRCAVGALTVLLAFSGLCWGDPYAPFNDRTTPVSIDPTPEAGDSLQSILDTIYGPGAVDAQTDQNTTGVWRTSSQRFPSIMPVLQFEAGTNVGANKFGIWSATSNTPGSITTVDIFKGAADPGNVAILQWLPQGILLTYSMGCNATVNCGFFSGISPDAFGFYIEGPGTGGGTGGKFWTLDALNGGNPQSVAYLYNPPGGAGAWTLAFSDTPGGNDYNNLIVSVESISAVPEPTTLALIGAGLVGIGLLRRRVQRRADQR